MATAIIEGEREFLRNNRKSDLQRFRYVSAHYASAVERGDTAQMRTWAERIKVHLEHQIHMTETSGWTT